MQRNNKSHNEIVLVGEIPTVPCGQITILKSMITIQQLQTTYFTEYELYKA